VSEKLLWDRLQVELTERVAGFAGVAGLCIKDLTTGCQVAVNAHEEFPTASAIKAPILAQMFRLAEAGKLDLSRRIQLTEDLKVPGSGVITYFDDVAELTVRDIAVLMIIVSDNTATNLCIDWATYEGTNALLRELGITKTTLRRKMQDHVAVERGEENLATPAEFVQFYEALFRPEKLSRYVCEETIKVLKKRKRSQFAQGLPQDVVLAGKPGGMDNVRTDAGIVYLDRRPYAMCVMTKYGMCLPSEQEQFIADVARTVHRHMTTLAVTSVHGQGLPPQFRK
jgi:beta-lactamase class A